MSLLQNNHVLADTTMQEASQSPAKNIGLECSSPKPNPTPYVVNSSVTSNVVIAWLNSHNALPVTRDSSSSIPIDSIPPGSSHRLPSHNATHASQEHINSWAFKLQNYLSLLTKNMFYLIFHKNMFYLI